jgi:hypothetical protein
MREEKKKKSKVVLVRDILYVNNELVEVRRDDTPGNRRVNLFFICNIKHGKLISSASSVFVSTKQSMS